MKKKLRHKKVKGLKVEDVTTIIKREQYVCSHCGSTNIKKDAFAIWDAKEQKWILENVFDAAYCDDCDGETTLSVAELK